MGFVQSGLSSLCSNTGDACIRMRVAGWKPAQGKQRSSFYLPELAKGTSPLLRDSFARQQALPPFLFHESHLPPVVRRVSGTRAKAAAKRLPREVSSSPLAPGCARCPA